MSIDILRVALEAKKGDPLRRFGPFVIEGEEALGVGQQGLVVRVINSIGRTFALKALDPGSHAKNRIERAIQRFLREVEILSQLGGECRMRNPWPDATITLYRKGGKAEEVSGSLVTFRTARKETITVVPKGSTPSRKAIP